MNSALFLFELLQSILHFIELREYKNRISNVAGGHSNLAC